MSTYLGDAVDVDVVTMTCGTEGHKQHSTGVKATKDQRIGSQLKLLFSPSYSRTEHILFLLVCMHDVSWLAASHQPPNLTNLTSPRVHPPQPGLRGDKQATHPAAINNLVSRANMGQAQVPSSFPLLPSLFDSRPQAVSS